MDAKLTSKQGDALFYRLCVDLGFCLRRDHIERLLTDPPEDVYSFTNAIFAAEGLNPERADQQLWRQVRGYVAAAFEPQPQPGQPPQFRQGEAAPN